MRERIARVIWGGGGVFIGDLVFGAPFSPVKGSRSSRRDGDLPIERRIYAVAFAPNNPQDMDRPFRHPSIHLPVRVSLSLRVLARGRINVPSSRSRCHR